jgi:hypothetical protein
LAYTNYINQTTSTKEELFKGIFKDCTRIIQADRLILPMTALTNRCYEEMFAGCTNLTTAPELPATTLANGCYSNMFNGCTSLTKAPKLPAVYLAAGCYDAMFKGCSSLTSAPVLNARSLVTGCYGNMFSGCTGLVTIKCYAKNIGGSMGELTNWVSGVAYRGTFYKRADVTWPSGVNGIPNGWTVINE